MSGRGRARRLAGRLSDRDLTILASLRRARLASGNQLGRLHFPTGEAATRTRKTRAALQRLTEQQLVVRLRRRVGGVHAGSQGFVYGLSGLGHAVLDLGHSPRRHRRVVETKPAFQTHTLAVTELWVELAEWAATGAGQLVEFCAEPGCWRYFHGVAGQLVALRPDADVRLEVDDYELRAFIELDLDTESLPTIGRKLAVYLAYWRSGQEQQRHGVFPRTWWLVPDATRAKSVRRAIGRLPAEAQSLFAVCLIGEAADRLTQLPTQGGAR